MITTNIISLARISLRHTTHLDLNRNRKDIRIETRVSCSSFSDNSICSGAGAIDHAILLDSVLQYTDTKRTLDSHFRKSKTQNLKTISAVKFLLPWTVEQK